MGQKLNEFRCGSHQAFVDRFARVKAEGDLPEEAAPVVLSRCIHAVAQGISLQAVSGATREELSHCR